MSIAKVKDGYQIPNNHNVIRFISNDLFRDGINISTDFWKLRTDKKEKYVSCMWYEYRNKDIEKIKKDLRGSLGDGIEGFLPIQCIKTIQEIAEKNGLMTVHAQYRGEKKQNSHCGLYNTSNDNLFLSEMAMETSRIIKQQQIKI